MTPCTGRQFSAGHTSNHSHPHTCRQVTSHTLFSLIGFSKVCEKLKNLGRTHDTRRTCNLLTERLQARASNLQLTRTKLWHCSYTGFLFRVPLMHLISKPLVLLSGPQVLLAGFHHCTPVGLTDTACTHTHTHTLGQFRVPNSPRMQDFRLWEEAGEPGEPMQTQGEHADSPQKGPRTRD